MFLAKNRNGPDGLVFPISMDTSNVRINVLPQTEEGTSHVIVKNAKDQQDLLKEKYKKFITKEGGK